MKKASKLMVCLLGLAISIHVKSQGSFVYQVTPTYKALKGISFSDASIGYACGDSGIILKTINSGNNWIKLVSPTVNNLWDIKVIPYSNGTKLIAVGDNNTVIKSIDGGVSWTFQSIPFQVGSFVFGIQCLDSLKYVACGGDYKTFSGAILKTTDGGLTWTSTPVPGSGFLDKIYMLNETTGYTVGSNLNFTDGVIQRITNGTNLNIRKQSPTLITNIWCKNEREITAIGLNGQIWESSDSGNTWVDRSVNVGNLFGIQFVNPQVGVICGGSNEGSEILYTKNGGINWNKIHFPFVGAFQTVNIIDGAIYLAGDEGIIIKGLVSALPVGISEMNQKEQLSIYPNPTTDYLTIDIAMNSNTEFNIYTTQGNLVMNGVFKSNKLEVAGLSSGLYVICIKDKNGNIQFSKFIKN